MELKIRRVCKQILVLLGNEGNRISIRVIHQSIPLFKRKIIIETPPTGNAPFISYSPSKFPEFSIL
jgi:hypothetical protein